jgi:hypothetical protein
VEGCDSFQGGNDKGVDHAVQVLVTMMTDDDGVVLFKKTRPLDLVLEVLSHRFLAQEYEFLVSSK